ncbi:MAG: hypothetical protein GQ523_06430 [Methanophagales archaeon]|nr:hypothetical protein [Methanophagales archaeon]
MRLNKILDNIIFRAVYKEVKVECELPYCSFELIEEIEEKIKTDEDFSGRYKAELSKQLQKQGYEKLEVIDIDTSSNCLKVRYTAYYSGRREYPEVHLKALLILHEEMGNDIYNPDVFAEIVERARENLGENGKVERLNHFATLFKGAMDMDLSPPEQLRVKL